MADTPIDGVLLLVDIPFCHSGHYYYYPMIPVETTVDVVAHLVNTCRYKTSMSIRILPVAEPMMVPCTYTTARKTLDL